MEQRFQLEQGQMSCTEFGKHVEIVVQLKNDGRGLYQAWIRGASGKVIELGSLIPTQGQLLLRRSIQLEDLKKADCWPIREGGVTLRHRFGGQDMPQGWKREENPARLLAPDPVLRALAIELRGCLICQSREGFSLAVPYGSRRPFPLIPIFCFSRIRTLGNGQYVVFPFDSEGRPRR